MTITTEANIDSGKLFDGKMNVKYEDQAVDITARFADESTKSAIKYSGEGRLTHVNSNTDLQFKVSSSFDLNILRYNLSLGLETVCKTSIVLYILLTSFVSYCVHNLQKP